MCRKNPHVKGPADRLKTKAYRVEERDGIIWIWIGDEAAADVDQLVDYSLFARTDGYVSVTGHLNINADYKLIIDNLMDLAHAEYIHPTTVGSAGAAERGTAKLVKHDGAISVNALWADSLPNAVTRSVWDRSERVDQYTDITWRAPANLMLDIAVAEPGHPRGSGLHMPSAHILTPASERTTHYFWAFGRDFHLDSAEMSDGIRHVVGTAFTTEDAPMIEAAQHMLDLTGQRLLNLTVGDAGSAEVRRAIDRAMAAQGACSAAA